MANRKILVADDDEAVLDYLQAKLGSRYDLVSTNAADNVLRLARSERPDLILCDIDMPDMDGGDVSAALFADVETRDIPLLFLTQLASSGDIEKLQGQIGGRPAVSKQLPFQQLLARIESLLKS